MSQLLVPRFLMVVDTETGGLDPMRHSLLTGTFLPIIDGKIAQRSHSFLLQAKEYHVTARAMEINQLQLSAVDKVGRAAHVVEQDVLAFIEQMQASVGTRLSGIVGQNLNFDLGFLNANFNVGMWWTPQTAQYDTLKICQLLKILGKYPQDRSTSLWSQAEFYGLELPNHTSTQDAYVTACLFLKQLEQLTREGEF